MNAKRLIVAVFLLGVAWAQEEGAVDTALSQLPPEYQVNATQIDGFKNQTLHVFQEKCEKNGGADAYSNAYKAFENLKLCVDGLVNMTVLKEEIEEGKPNGKVDEVFKKYCAKKSQFKDCLTTGLEAAKPCFSADEQKNVKILHNVTEQLAEFVCFKDGDRIALFIAEGGPECFQEQQDAIQNCINSTQSIVDPRTLSIDSLPDIKFGREECAALTKLQTCVVSNLELCPQPTTANIAESLFKYIRKGTPCKDFTDKGATVRDAKEGGKNQKPDSATAVAVTSLTLLMALATLLV